MASVKPTSSLLCLPFELRRQIYLELFHTNLHCNVVDNWIPVGSTSPFRSRIKLGRNRLRIPWLNLALTCQLIASEIRETMAEAMFREDEHYTTYVLDLESSNGGPRSSAWACIPCSPDKVTKLVVNMNFHNQRVFWERASPEICHLWKPGPQLHDLYQTLNHFVHCGPRLDPGRPLAKPLQIPFVEVIVRNRLIHWDHGPPMPAPDVYGCPFMTTLGFLNDLASAGVWNSSIAVVQLLDEHSQQGGFDQMPVNDPNAVHGPWCDWGYDWGIDFFNKEVHRRGSAIDFEVRMSEPVTEATEGEDWSELMELC